jgi:hypothetical protein
MKGQSGELDAYRQFSAAGRRWRTYPLYEVTCTLRGFLPLSRTGFERRLDGALGEAGRRGRGFYIAGFAARRALGSALVIDIDPGVLREKLQVEFMEGEQVRLVRDKFLGAGDWSPLLRTIRHSSTYREVAEIIKFGFDYRQAQAYREALERASGSRPKKRNFVALNTPKRVEQYYRQTAETCRSIAERGVVRRIDYGRRFADSRPWIRLPWIELGELDVGVAIGAKGEIYRFASGKHRTAAAQALGLKSMPVEIRMVHADWLKQRIAESGSTPIDALLNGVRGLGVSSASV